MLGWRLVPAFLALSVLALLVANIYHNLWLLSGVSLEESWRVERPAALVLSSSNVFLLVAVPLPPVPGLAETYNYVVNVEARLYKVGDAVKAWFCLEGSRLVYAVARFSPSQSYPVAKLEGAEQLFAECIGARLTGSNVSATLAVEASGLAIGYAVFVVHVRDKNVCFDGNCTLFSMVVEKALAEAFSELRKGARVEADIASRRALILASTVYLSGARVYVKEELYTPLSQAYLIVALAAYAATALAFASGLGEALNLAPVSAAALPQRHVRVLQRSIPPLLLGYLVSCLLGGVEPPSTYVLALTVMVASLQPILNLWRSVGSRIEATIFTLYLYTLVLAASSPAEAFIGFIVVVPELVKHSVYMLEASLITYSTAWFLAALLARSRLLHATAMFMVAASPIPLLTSHCYASFILAVLSLVLSRLSRK